MNPIFQTGLRMELFAGFSDDMVAVFGCLAAFILCGSLTALTYAVGRRRRASAGSENFRVDRAKLPATAQRRVRGRRAA